MAPDPQRLAWITLLAIMNEDGIAPLASAANLAHTARISLEDAQAALLAFTSPDPLDPEQPHEGRRIERIEGGWLILNAEKYRAIASKEAATERSKIRMQKYRERLRTVTAGYAADGNGCAKLQKVTTSGSGALALSEAREDQEGVQRETARKRAPVGSRLPDKFTLTDQRRAFAESQAADPELQFAQFTDYWRAATGRNATKRDWDAAWRTWCRNAANYTASRRPGNGYDPLAKLTWKPTE